MIDLGKTTSVVSVTVANGVVQIQVQNAPGGLGQLVSYFGRPETMGFLALALHAMQQRVPIGGQVDANTGQIAQLNVPA